MTVSRLRAEAGQADTRQFVVDRRALLLVLGFALVTVIVRLPSFFEPPWHTDEGIFAAVAQRVATGGRLYTDAWESKPPLFLYIYVAIIKVFGAGVLPLRIAAALSAFGTELAIYGIARKLRMTQRQAFAAAGTVAVLLAVPFWEGNLAVTETFTVLPTALAVLCVMEHESPSSRRHGLGWLLAAGALFGAAFLIRQTSAVVAVSVVLWLLVSGGRWLRSSLMIALGSAAIVLPAVGAFAVFNDFYWFWDANIGFFFNYVPSGKELPILYRPLIILPVVVAGIALLAHRLVGQRPRWSLPTLWLVTTLAAAMLTGRPYPHYMLQIFPPLGLLVALIAPEVRLSWRPRWDQLPAGALVLALVLLWYAVVRPEFQGNLLAMRYAKAGSYYANFLSWSVGRKDRRAYEAYFDKRVALSRDLSARLDQLHARGQKLYIWGEYPWVYAMSGTQPATPYMTSFYTLLIPFLDVELAKTLQTADPQFIVMMADAWPSLYDATGVVKWRYTNAEWALNSLIARRYEQVAVVGRARIFERQPERPAVSDIPYTPQVETTKPAPEEPLVEKAPVVSPEPAEDEPQSVEDQAMLRR